MTLTRFPRSLATVAVLSLILCGAAATSSRKAAAPANVGTIPEVLRTQDWPGADVDSVALWRDSKGGALLFVTAKQANAVYACDGLTGKIVATVGKPGKGLGEFSRPNGVAVIDEYLIVTERDGHRVQVFDLPSLKPVLFFGQEVLLLPYGLTVFRSGGGYELYVTDDYPVGNASRRVKHFRLVKSEGVLDAKLINVFGETRGPGVLQKVESILADPTRDRLYICDEATREIKIYSLAGQFTGRTIGKGIIRFDPEGMKRA